MIARCLDVELHSLVPFLIDGFVFAMPGLMAYMNPTARLHAFAEIRHSHASTIFIIDEMTKSQLQPPPAIDEMRRPRHRESAPD